jgi:bifunctional pyridoxal-dependent enzyme with beta-cystathionase and maltose regulon repressor activities
MCEQLGIIDTYNALPTDKKAHTSPSSMLQMFLLYKHGVATMDRNSFGKVGVTNEHFLRLSIATSMERLQEGVSRMRTAATDRDGFQAFLREEKMYA